MLSVYIYIYKGIAHTSSLANYVFSEIITTLLTFLFQRFFPFRLKLAQIIPLLKKPKFDKDTPSNYHPIFFYKKRRHILRPHRPRRSSFTTVKRFVVLDALAPLTSISMFRWSWATSLTSLLQTPLETVCTLMSAGAETSQTNKAVFHTNISYCMFWFKVPCGINP